MLYTPYWLTPPTNVSRTRLEPRPKKGLQCSFGVSSSPTCDKLKAMSAMYLYDWPISLLGQLPNNAAFPLFATGADSEKAIANPHKAPLSTPWVERPLGYCESLRALQALLPSLKVLAISKPEADDTRNGICPISQAPRKTVTWAISIHFFFSPLFFLGRYSPTIRDLDQGLSFTVFLVLYAYIGGSFLALNFPRFHHFWNLWVTFQGPNPTNLTDGTFPFACQPVHWF